ncbi:MAG: sigma-54-dependent Fis family transcriptional regulator [Deltaproteobacteria bacterium]|nr:sigma-54-dependent Fis family transcriptional regulator [Deltaproteobacteria bacterium]MBW2070405.1 sigma-54-dependent Fis family transcriptional regulator [Deltaproteobacteria bacterium]
MRQKRILIIDDEENMRHMLTVLLEKEGYAVTSAANGKDGLAKAETTAFDVILCDLKMPVLDGMSFLKEFQQTGIDSTVIMMSAYGTLDMALEAMKLGAYDYVSKPFKTDEVLLTLKKAEERERLRRENQRLQKSVKERYSFACMIGRSAAMQEIFATIERIAAYKSTVLITGESGTGKELIARAIHYNSPRARQPLVTVNCGAIPETLLESELFGHCKGAFTDAASNKLGLFAEADGGSIFLDEIGELPLALQVKLLRVLQEGEFKRLGDTRTMKVDTRVIAATTKNLALEVSEGRFRDDLYYRINVLQICVPPLRDRRLDIPLLANHFIDKTRERLGCEARELSPQVMRTLQQYPWPGNVRELENVIERAMIMAQGKRIEVDDLPPEIVNSKGTEFQPQEEADLSIKAASRLLEKNLIQRALEKTGGNRTQAARLLEISHPALLYKMKAYGLGDSQRG